MVKHRFKEGDIVVLTRLHIDRVDGCGTDYGIPDEEFGREFRIDDASYGDGEYGMRPVASMREGQDYFYAFDDMLEHAGGPW